jgi:hypothetical protein
MWALAAHGLAYLIGTASFLEQTNAQLSFIVMPRMS